MSIFKIQLSNNSETFQISLAGKDYIMTIKYTDADEGGWVMDMTDAVTNISIAANLPLITGADIFSGLQYLGFNGQMIVYTDGDEDAVPTFENLGIESNLYFQTDISDA